MSATDIEGDVVNAELPLRLRVSSVLESIEAVVDPTCMPGELGINATSDILDGPICVMSKNNSVMSIYGVNSFNSADVLFIQFESVGQDIGHYDSLVKVLTQKILIHKLSPLSRPSAGKKITKKDNL